MIKLKCTRIPLESTIHLFELLEPNSKLIFQWSERRKIIQFFIIFEIIGQYSIYIVFHSKFCSF